MRGSATDERKLFNPYYENKMSFLVRKADLDKYKGSFKPRKCQYCNSKELFQETMVKEQLPNAQLTSLTNIRGSRQ